MQRSWRDLGTPLYAPAYFEAIVEAFPEQTRIFVCHRNDEPVAVAFNGYDRRAPWRACGQARLRLGHELNANYVLYWEMIKESCERGLSPFSPRAIDCWFGSRAIQEEVERGD